MSWILGAAPCARSVILRWLSMRTPAAKEASAGSSRAPFRSALRIAAANDATSGSGQRRTR